MKALLKKSTVIALLIIVFCPALLYASGRFGSIPAKTAIPPLESLRRNLADSNFEAFVPLANTKIVNLVDYGGVGDDSTLNDSAFTAALAALDATYGGIIFIPPGKYRVSAAIAINRGANIGNVYIVGSGMQSTFIVTTSATADVVAFGTTSNVQYKYGIRDLTIMSSTTRTAGAFVKITQCNTVSIERVYCYAPYYGIQIVGTATAGTVMVHINDCEIGETVNNGSGIYVDNLNGNEIFIKDTLIASSQVSGNYGLKIIAGEAVYAAGMSIIGHSYGLLIVPSSEITTRWNTFTQCFFDTAETSCVTLAANSGCSIYGTVFINCWMTNAQGGFGFFSVGDGVIDGTILDSCRIFVNLQHGVYVATGTNFKLNNCLVAGNGYGASPAGSYHGVVMGSNVVGFTITNNTVNNMGGWGNWQGYGIYISPDCDYYIVTSNNCYQNVSGGVLDASALTHKWVANNLP